MSQKTFRLMTLFLTAFCLLVSATTGLNEAVSHPSNLTAMSRSLTLPAPFLAQAEDAAVYSALLDSLFVKASLKQLVIEKETSGCVGIGNNKEGEKARQLSLNKLTAKLSGLKAATIADFKKNERQCRSIEASFNLRINTTLLDKAEKNRLFSTKDVSKAWQSFYAKYPGSSGYINLSNIGFSADKTQALVNVFRKCGGGCGGEQFVLLKRVGGKWTVAATHKIWEMGAQ